ncbi:MAG: metallophosphoesterase [Kofleriaceae bacterium]
MNRAARAAGLASELDDRAGWPARSTRWVRSVAIGDPQCHAAKLFAVLDHAGVLGDDGRLRPDVQLVSIGDHFDFGTRAAGTLDDARRDGPAVLRWLCAHDPAQVTVLVGNHDLARVDELAAADDATFAAAALAAPAVLAERAAEPGAYAAALRAYAAQFPGLPGPGLVLRDLAAFTEAQRRLVQHQLTARRMTLATTARAPSGRALLLTHAAVTEREVAGLGLAATAGADEVAAALQGLLVAAVAAVAPAWRRGEVARPALAPVHVGAATALVDEDLPEGGGLLYHRPADPERPGADRRWEREAVRPRRYHPRALPRGLAQVCGHTGHPKCVAELARFCDPPLAETLSGRRTLEVDRVGRVRYRLGIHPGDADGAVLYLIDPSLHRAPDPAAVELLELAPGSVTGGPT